MAIEWATKIKSEASFRDVLQFTNIFLREITGNRSLQDFVIALECEKNAEAGWVPATSETLGFRHNPTSYEGNGRSVVFSIPQYDAFSFLLANGIGDPAQDEEYGNFIYVDSGRTRPSVVLSMAAVIGAAVACHGKVWDETLSFHGDRISSPETIVQSIKVDDSYSGFADSVDKVLSNTGMVNYLLD